MHSIFKTRIIITINPLIVQGVDAHVGNIPTAFMKENAEVTEAKCDIWKKFD